MCKRLSSCLVLSLFTTSFWLVQAAPDQAKGLGEIRVTKAQTANCGPDYIRRQPGALADLDGDGALERVAVEREGETFLVRLHRLPGLKVVGQWHVPGHYIEVGSTRCQGRKQGTLWLHVGKALDPKGERWANALYRLQENKLVVTAEDVVQSNLFVDVDGDGCIDPLVTDSQGGRVYRAGAWERLPDGVEPMRLSGLPFEYSQRQAIDLDGDGSKELLSIDDRGLHLLRSSDWKITWSATGKIWNASVTRWNGRLVIVANVDEVFKVFSADAAHTELAAIKGKSYAKLLAELDPTGDGTTLAVQELSTQLLSATKPSALTDLKASLAGPLDDETPMLGPALFLRENTLELLAVKIIKHGHPMLAFPGSDAQYELLLLPPGAQEGRAIRKASVHGDLNVLATVVDMRHDGRNSIVLHESAGYSSCDRKSHGSSSTLYLLGGDGTILWQDQTRHQYYEPHRQSDREAHARAMDLWGDGRKAVRVRADDQEWYLLPAGASVPDPLPVCLE